MALVSNLNRMQLVRPEDEIDRCSESENSLVRIWRDTIDSKPTGVTVVALNRPSSLNALTVEGIFLFFFSPSRDTVAYAANLL